LVISTNSTARSENEPCTLLRRVEISSEEYGLHLNEKKSKVLSTAGLQVFNLDGMNIEVVSSFRLLGAIIHEEGTCAPEIKHRLLLGRVVMGKLDQIWKDKDI